MSTVYNRYCNAQSRNCQSGCCKSDYTCATKYLSCTYTYSDFYSDGYLYYNKDKYCFPDDIYSCNKKEEDSINLVAIIAGGVSGVVALLVIIGIVVYCCRRNRNVQAQAVHEVSMVNPAGSHSVIIGQITYGREGIQLEQPSNTYTNQFTPNNPNTTTYIDPYMMKNQNQTNCIQ